jgi:acetyl esterase/lipase
VRVLSVAAVPAVLVITLAACDPAPRQPTQATTGPEVTGTSRSPEGAPAGGFEHVDADTELTDVVGHPAFEGYGRFLLPAGRGTPITGGTLRDAGDLLPYHSHVDVASSVAVVNALIASVEQGRTVFLDIYSDDAKATDPGKQDTGLFFFPGRPGAPFAIVSAGGGFSYVGSIHESLPYALELSRKGYNAFALQYRTGGAQVACEDLAAAISTVFDRSRELGVATGGYSLWGGSAGARMAAYLGSYGPSRYGGADLPRPAAVIMQYTGHTDYTAQDPPTWVGVGEDDGIANWRTMKRRVDAMSQAGIATEFHLYPDLGHGFGLGIGTSAAGWIDDAVAFWERHRNR